MILATKYSGNHELRSFAAASAIIPSPATFGGAWSQSGELVNLSSAVGLPAVLDVIRLVSEVVGMLPLIVYKGVAPDRERARESWQWDLLHDAPNPDCSAFDFFSDVASSLEGTGNAYIWKIRQRDRLVALYVLDPNKVQVKQNPKTMAITYVVQHPGGQTEYTRRDILHIRGFTLTGGYVGLSPIALCRNAIGAGLAMQRFSETHFKNYASPHLIAVFPQGVSRDQASEWQTSWEANYGGENIGRPAAMGGGVDIKVMPISLEDAQFVESQKFTVEQVHRIFRIESLDDPQRFLKFSLMPRLRRIEMALRSDQDLFGAGDLFPEFLADAIERAAIDVRYRAYKDARQGSWITGNEVREKENMRPKEGADDILITPTGSAPNPAQSNLNEDERALIDDLERAFLNGQR